MRLLPRARHCFLVLALAVGGSQLSSAAGQQVLGNIQPLPAVTDSDERFGLGNVYPEPHWLRLAQQAGVRWNRWEFRWDAIERQRGHLDFAGSDRLVNTITDSGIKIQGILISIPRWAEARTDEGGTIPRGLYEPWDSPQNTWGSFVRTMAERYRGRVQAWEIWNEPDYPRGDFIFWFGSKSDYFQLLKVSYHAIRSVDPHATILVAGLMYWGDPTFLEDLLAMARADPDGARSQHFFDGIAWHVYSRPSEVYERVQRSRLLLQTYVGHKAIWVNEGNLPVWPESAKYGFQRFPLSGTLEEQAAWVVQWHAYALAAGADRVLMYRMHDSDEPEAWGLARSDGSSRPAYVAYQLAARYLSHAHTAVRATLGDVEQLVFYRPEQRVKVVWNRGPRPLTAQIGAAAPQATLVAVDGSQLAITPQEGTYQLELPPATANSGPDPYDYLVGGQPYFIVEDLLSTRRRVEESESVLQWSGRWKTEAQAAASGGSQMSSGQAGASVSFAFNGPSVTWYTSLTPRGGVARLSLNDAPLAEVDLHSHSVVPQHTLTFVDLGPGPHVLTVTATGTHDPHALGADVVVDAFVAEQSLRAPPAPTPLPEVTPAPVLVPSVPTPSPAGTPSPQPTPTRPPGRR